MRRMICKWYISRAIDLEIAIPTIVQRWINRDPVLKDYQNRVDRLESVLRNDLASELDFVGPSVASDIRHPTPRTRNDNSRILWKTPVVAAAVVVTALVLLTLDVKPRRDDQASKGAQQPDAASGAAFSDEIRRESNPPILASEIGETIASGSKIVQLMVNRPPYSDWLETKLDVAFRQVAAEPVRRSLLSTRTLMKSTLSASDDGIVLEANHLVTDVRNGMRFFTRTLPTRLIEHFKTEVVPTSRKDG